MTSNTIFIAVSLKRVRKDTNTDQRTVADEDVSSVFTRVLSGLTVRVELESGGLGANFAVRQKESKIVSLEEAATLVAVLDLEIKDTSACSRLMEIHKKYEPDQGLVML